MGAISLYRGNLHRFSDVPRRWPIYPRAISLSQFRNLLRKRNITLSRFSAGNPNLNSSFNPSAEEGNHVGMSETDGLIEVPISLASYFEPSGLAVQSQSKNKDQAEAVEGSNNCNTVVKLTADRPALTGEDSLEVIGLPAGRGGNSYAEEVICELDANEKEVKKRDLEKKLDALNEKKHYLVQMLKQILNAEEEIKRRSIQSAAAARSSAPQHAEASAQTSCAAINPPKISVDVNFAGDVGGESDAAANHIIQAHQWPPMPTTSPSPTSLCKTPNAPFHHNTAHTPRGNVPHQATTSGSLMASLTASPACFVPNTVSVSGTHFATSYSMSPAASGGTSSPFRFRDFRS